MTRLLTLAALVLFVLVVVRRAFAAGRRSVERTPRSVRPGEEHARKSGAPESLVCGACGFAFDPEQSGWICPRCGK